MKIKQIYIDKIQKLITSKGLIRGISISIIKALSLCLNKLKFKKKINLWQTNPPYKYVQDITEYNIHQYLGIDSRQILSWCIVGGFDGDEVPTIINNYTNCKITIFECSHRYIGALRSKLSKENRVEIVEKAVSDRSGKTKFFEVSGTGSGSLLKIGDLHKKSYGMEQAETFDVETISLDEYFLNQGVDILQIDVQGAEKLVLKGAVNVLENTKAIFIEISIKPEMYESSIKFKDLEEILEAQNFQLILLGTDTNGTGNALFIKKENITDKIWSSEY